MKKYILLLVILLLGFLVFYFWPLRLAEAPKEVVEEPDFVPEVAVKEVAVTERPDVEVVAKNLQIPWEVVFLEDLSAQAGGTILATERPGSLAVIKNGKISRIPVQGVHHAGEGGLLGMALHSDFKENKFLYLYFTYRQGGQIKNKVERYVFNEDALSGSKVIIDNIPGASNHNGGRIAFGPDGYLYITTGDAGNPALAQDTSSLAGKILRLKDDGLIPQDNPFGNPVWSFGHRNPQGLAWDQAGQLWSTEHGPSGIVFPNCCQDEINLIEKGKNYGWPDSVGDKAQSGTVAPKLHSKGDTWAPGGAAYWRGSLFFAGLRGQSLYEAELEGSRVVELKQHFQGEFGRIRSVSVGPDGFLYIITSNRDGRGVPQSTDDRIVRLSF